eukprot:TRINITY_DN24320_c0_g1_i1.p1 TRINITY_DN24320_c0_g1~~TRINITY_DN24320_c0_g1_i1.p1  ORF type:complete len:671 (+),score=107.82 TRINITY_DN24320_c0_g1_i1:86-2098(+)
MTGFFQRRDVAVAAKVGRSVFRDPGQMAWLPSMRSLLLLCLLLQLDGTDVDSVFPPKLSADDAFQLLTDTLLEETWPSFRSNTSLLDLAFAAQDRLPNPAGARTSNPTIVSMEPRILLFDDFFSSDECEFLKASGRHRFKPAMVVENSANWYDQATQTRNNEQVWLSPTEETKVPLLRHILKRMHREARVPDRNAEALQIGRYNVTQKYEAHLDSAPESNVARPMTMIVYLDDVDGGGHTYFPGLRADCGQGWRKDLKTGEDVYGAALCCNTPEMDHPTSVRVVPKKGRAVLFFNHHPNGKVDKSASHLSCPVTKGVKWIVQRWFRYEPYQNIDYSSGPGRDPRFDGLPSMHGHDTKVSVSSPDSPHFRSLSTMNPRLYLIENYLSKDECDFLVELARPHVKVSKGLEDPKSGKKQWELPEEVMIEKVVEKTDAKLSSIYQRSHKLTRFLSNETSVGMRIRRWGVGSAEHLHTDSTPPNKLRPATVLMFLSDVEQGGEVIFPTAEETARNNECASLEACCGNTQMALRPRKGDALLIYSHTVEGDFDRASQHANCPVVKGELWVAEHRFRFEEPPEDKKNSVEEKRGTGMQIRFQNNGAYALKVYWKSKQGEVFLDDISAGPAEVKTFATTPYHEFVVRDVNGNIVREAVAEPGKSNIVIEDSGNDRTEI